MRNIFILYDYVVNVKKYILYIYGVLHSGSQYGVPLISNSSIPRHYSSPIHSVVSFILFRKDIRLGCDGSTATVSFMNT